MKPPLNTSGPTTRAFAHGTPRRLMKYPATPSSLRLTPLTVHTVLPEAPTLYGSPACAITASCAAVRCDGVLRRFGEYIGPTAPLVQVKGNGEPRTTESPVPGFD